MALPSQGELSPQATEGSSPQPPSHPYSSAVNTLVVTSKLPFTFTPV